MKIRSGFVSNSSSSSFIVAVKNHEKCPVCKRSDVSFLDLIENMNPCGDGYETTRLRARGRNAIISRWIRDVEPYCSEDEKNTHDSVERLMTEAEAKGYEIGEVEISYGDSITDYLLDDLKKRGVVQILWSNHFGVDLSKITL